MYKNLVRELDKLGIVQVVYTPVKSASLIGKNKINFKTKGSKIIYAHILHKTLDRVFYKRKLKRIFKDIRHKVDLQQIDCIHAHTWYSDGGVAYLLHKKYSIPYVVAVRNSDLNAFYKYRPHQRGFGRQILIKAQHIVLISATYKTKLLSLSALQKVKPQIAKKLNLIPNGVAPFWLAAAKPPAEKTINGCCHVLFIGKFTKNKNVVALQEAIKLFKQEHRLGIKLHLVGGGRSEEAKVLEQVEAHPELFKYYGKVFDKTKLREIFDACHLFAMPSKHETFGLVYIEALLRGLPVLYTQNEGIDGFYAENIGEKVTKISSVEEIKQKLDCLVKNYAHYAIPTDKIKQNHDWKAIAKAYTKIYS